MSQQDLGTKLTKELLYKLNDIEGRLDLIEARNKQVEANKAWETGKIRIISITILTYIIMFATISYLGLPKPMVSALIPTLGFFLSTLPLNFIKKRFIAKLK